MEDWLEGGGSQRQRENREEERREERGSRGKRKGKRVRELPLQKNGAGGRWEERI